MHLEIETCYFEIGARSQGEVVVQVMKLLIDFSSVFRRPQTVVIYQIQFLVLNSYHQNQDDLDHLHRVGA